MEKFKNLGLNDNTIQLITKLGYKEPTEIQEKTIPLIAEGNDVIAQSATGTGKTFAFLSVLLQKAKPNKKIQILVVTPTRELANQIYEESKKLIYAKQLSSCVVYGGVSKRPQVADLRRSEIVITTPGRILDHLQSGTVRLDQVNSLILDEADRMCDMGFLDDITTIIENTPKEKQMLLFSATITKDVTKIERKYMPKAKRVVVKYFVDASKLHQEYYKVKNNVKVSLLIHLIKNNKSTGKSVVFCNTRSAVDLIDYNLKEAGLNSFKLHGGLEQNKRSKISYNFKKQKNAILVSTDVSARGIHIDNLNTIYNFDLPKENTQYVHRIGRTARAGKEGKAISILMSKEVEPFIKMCKKFKFNPILKERPKFDILPLKKPIHRRNPDSKRSVYFAKKTEHQLKNIKSVFLDSDFKKPNSKFKNSKRYISKQKDQKKKFKRKKYN